MARDLNSKCKKCRRAGEKLFLKGDRCDSPKCAMVRKPYAPGAHGKTMSRGQSEYGRQLAMKQKIKRIYGVLEKQFRHHFEEISNKPGVTGDLLLQRLEMRLDSVVKNIGFAASPAQARQLVAHGAFRVNGKKVDVPSYEVKIGDTISIGETKLEKTYFKTQAQALKARKQFPSWVHFEANKLEAKILHKPSCAEMAINVDPQMVVEYYSR